MHLATENHSTKQSIKIFVSRRLDLNSVIVPNPLYVPVICGTVYSKNQIIKGCVRDDRGNNISYKRDSFCELTVEYWAWKNQISDYYGLCHYRRYLTFVPKKFITNNEGLVSEGFLDKRSILKFGLLDEKLMYNSIVSCDAVVNSSVDVEDLFTPIGRVHNVWEFWAAYDGIYFNQKVLPLMMDLIKVYNSKYYVYALKYMKGKWHRGFNCYILKKDLFFEMCEFQFSILFKLEKILATKGLDKQFERTLGYIGEILYGIFIYYLQQKAYNVQEKQLVYFEHTLLPKNKLQMFFNEMLYFLKVHFESTGFILLPRGTRRRHLFKKLYMLMTRR